MKRKFEPIADKCGEIVDWLMSSSDMPADDGLLFKIRLSLEETVENVVRYAYDDGLGWIEVGTERSGDGLQLLVELRDAGKPFNPLLRPDPDIHAPLEERQIGGLGIFLSKQMMDDISYRYEDGCNVLTLTKNITRP